MTCRQKKAVIKKKIQVYLWYPIRQYNNFEVQQILINTLNQEVRLKLKYKDFYAKSKQLKIISNV